MKKLTIDQKILDVFCPVHPEMLDYKYPGAEDYPEEEKHKRALAEFHGANERFMDRHCLKILGAVILVHMYLVYSSLPCIF